MSFGRNTEEREQIQQSFEPGDRYPDPRPSPRGPAFDPAYDGNTENRARWEQREAVHPLTRQTPEGMVAASYFGRNGVLTDPWVQTSPGSLLYRNSLTGSVMIRRPK